MSRLDRIREKADAAGYDQLTEAGRCQIVGDLVYVLELLGAWGEGGAHAWEVEVEVRGEMLRPLQAPVRDKAAADDIAGVFREHGSEAHVVPLCRRTPASDGPGSHDV